MRLPRRYVVLGLALALLLGASTGGGATRIASSDGRAEVASARTAPRRPSVKRARGGDSRRDARPVAGDRTVPPAPLAAPAAPRAFTSVPWIDPPPAGGAAPIAIARARAPPSQV